jgi:hypothetical protein
MIKNVYIVQEILAEPIGGSTEVEHFLHHSKIKWLSPTASIGSRR